MMGRGISFFSTLAVAVFAALPALADPRMEIAAPSADFGSVTNGSLVRHDFGLRNSGDSSLVIHSVTPDCESCTRVRLDRNVVPAGERAVLSVEFDPKGLTGAVKRAVLLESNDEARPRQVVMFSARVMLAKVTNGLAANPALIVFHAGGVPETRVVFVSQIGGFPVRLLDAVAPSTNLACEIYEESGRPNYRVYVRKKGALSQADEGNLVLRAADAERPSIAVRVWIENSTSTP